VAPAAGPTARSDRRVHLAAAATSLLLAVLALGPMLRPGSPLRYDLVSVPRQVLGPEALGLGDRLPRAVPLDAATWLLGFLLGGWVSQALALAALVLAGWGAALLVQGSLPARLLACVVAVANPFVLEQLAIGHVPHLVSYGCLPWAALAGHRLAACGDTASEVSGAASAATSAAGLAAVMLVGSLTPGGGVLCAGAALAGLLHGRRSGSGGRVLGGVLLAALAQLPWLVAGLAHPAVGQPAAAARASVADFSVRAESALGRVVDTLGLGGMWNAQALPTSRTTWLAPAGTVLLLALALIGLRAVIGRPELRRAVGLGAALAGLGYLVALLPTAPGGVDLLARLVEAVPGAALLRDGHRWLAWPALALAVLAGYAVDHLARAAARRWAVALLLAALAAACVPDLFGGLAGRLAARQYPPAWAQARQILADQPDRARLLVLPWQPFRRFGWTADGTVLDPAPRYLPREAVVSDALTVGRRTLPEEGPLARRTAAALADGRLTDAELRDAGVGWVLVERGTPGALPVLPPVRTVLDDPDLVLARLPGPLPDPVPAPAWRRAVVVTSLVVAPSGVIVAVLVAIGLRFRDRRRHLLLRYPPVTP
jgi:hypothetical protein